MAFTALTTAETDAKSPIDDSLMLKIKDNFDDLNSRVIAAGVSPLPFEVIGRLSFLNTYPQYRSLAGMILSKEFTPSLCRFGLKKSGSSGTMTIDIRKHTSPKTPITEIAYQYSGATTSIGRAGSSLNTQSVARATTQISTQSITHAKAAVNIQSIVGLGAVFGLGSNVWQYNLSAALDADTVVGDSIVFASATTGANNGTFVITAIGRGGGANVCVENASGVAQTGAAGTAQIKIMSYNFTNPVDSLFTAGYSHAFASHTNAANDGTLAVYAINQSGNNIWVKNPTGVTQGGAAGTADCNFWKFALSSAASTTDYIVGEKALTASHSSGGNNNSALTIIAVNLTTNNLVLYNTAGVVQAGVAGTINTNRWIYAMPSDPSSQVTAGDTFYMSGHTNVLNDGVFTIKEVNRSAANNLVVYNTSGVAQGGTTGTAYSTKKLVKFSSDQSANYTTDSYIEMWLCASAIYNAADAVAPFRVLEVNRGGGANYNVVIDSPLGPAQSGAAGYVKTEMKSIFSSAPTLSADATGTEGNSNVVGGSTALSATVIAANTPLMLYVTNAMSGDPRDLTVSLL